MEIKSWPVTGDPPRGEMPVFCQLLLPNDKSKEILVILLPVLKNGIKMPSTPGSQLQGANGLAPHCPHRATAAELEPASIKP